MLSKRCAKRFPNDLASQCFQRVRIQLLVAFITFHLSLIFHFRNLREAVAHLNTMLEIPEIGVTARRNWRYEQLALPSEVKIVTVTMLGALGFGAEPGTHALGAASGLA